MCGYTSYPHPLPPTALLVVYKTETIINLRFFLRGPMISYLLFKYIETIQTIINII